MFLSRRHTVYCLAASIKRSPHKRLRAPACPAVKEHPQLQEDTPIRVVARNSGSSAAAFRLPAMLIFAGRHSASLPSG